MGKDERGEVIGTSGFCSNRMWPVQSRLDGAQRIDQIDGYMF